MKDTPQKSEAHTSTADASTSPASESNRSTMSRGREKRVPSADREPVEPTSTDAVTIDDQTDVGGPLRIRSDDPDLQPPIDVPKDPFPTDRTPEIDPPVDQTRTRTKE